MRDLWPRVVHVLVILVLPVVLLAASLRAVTAHWLVDWQYGSAGVPADPYGMTAEERVDLASACVDYLVTGAGIDLLADLDLEDGPAFNERELQHMVDVKRAFRGLSWAGVVAGLVAAGGTVGLAARQRTRHRAALALLGGGLLTVGLLLAVGGLMVVRWEVFFIAFHDLFFPPGTWIFPTSDTLIRLFPVRFWMNVAAVVVALLTAQSVAIGVGGYLWYRSVLRDRT